MRKVNIFYITALSSLLLSSCIWHENHRVDIFFECNLFLQQDDITYNLKVEKIDEQAFINAKGFNVVKDEVAEEKSLENRYFLITFSSLDSEQKVTQYDFYNLQQVTKTKKQKISYKDDFFHFVIPTNYYLGSDYSFYSIKFNSSYISIGDMPQE